MRTRSMRALLLVVALACPAAAGSAAAAPAYAPPVQERHLDDERDCTQIPPERVPSPLAADPGVLPLEVRVLVEARDLPKARSSFAVTRGVFQRIGIDLRVSYDVVPAAGHHPHR